MFKNDDVCDLIQIDLARVRKIRGLLTTTDAVQALADTFSALGDPTRVRILDALAHGELCVCDLAAVLGLSQSGVSHQLRLLRGQRLVRPRREGRIVFYALDDQHIMSIFRQTLQHVEERRDVGPPLLAHISASDGEVSPKRPAAAKAETRTRETGFQKQVPAAARRRRG